MKSARSWIEDVISLERYKTNSKLLGKICGIFEMPRSALPPVLLTSTEANLESEFLPLHESP